MNNSNTSSTKKVTFTDAKAGDRVWSITEGWGVVKKRTSPHDPYPLVVEFENGTHIIYTLWGRRYNSDLNPTLFWDEVKIEAPEKPMPELQVDTKVIVWGCSYDSRVKRHFSHFENGTLRAFDRGQTSWTGIHTSAWPNWECVNED